MKINPRTILISLSVTLGLVGAVTTATPAYASVNCGDAANATKPACATKKGIDATGTKKTNCGDSGDAACGIGDAVETVTNVLLFIIGAISVIMIILGGIRYVLSNGEAQQIAAAKNTILYAVIGLVVALLAYAIVGFVINQFT